MKIALSWLEEYIEEKPDWDLVFDKLTQAGIEIEGVEVDSLGEKIVELKITPNRGDCLSVKGLLREIATLTQYKYNFPPIDLNLIEYADYPISNTSNNKVNVTIDNPTDCPNYFGIVIENVDNTRKLPDIITNRLLKSGLRTVSPVFDIANYVMLETGQPLHSFDLDHIGDKLNVRRAKDGEKIKLLNDTEVTLTNDTLLICEAKDTPVAIAGVMGGLDSGVSEHSKNIFIESAYFDKDVVAGIAKQYGVTSDAAYRFERGVDFKIQENSLLYATHLIVKYLGGVVGSITKVNNTNYNAKPMVLKFDDFTRLIGVVIEPNTIKQILCSLGFSVDENNSHIFVIPPSYRFDIAIKEDIIEEVARIYGYDNIPAVLPNTNYTMYGINTDYAKNLILKNLLVNRGYSEVVSYAFLEKSYVDLFNYSHATCVELKNPIAGFSTMRTSLFAGLIKTMQYNVNRGATSVKLFELARVFYGEGEKFQPLKLAGLCYGEKYTINWADSKTQFDFFDIKGDLESLLSFVDTLEFIPCNDNPVLHSGRCAKILLSGNVIGIIGQLTPLVAQELGLNTAPYLFELDIHAITDLPILFKVKPVSKFQKIQRDLAFVVDNSLNSYEVIKYIRSLSIAQLREVNVFDVYSGDKLEAGGKSLAFKLYFQADKTLTDSEINEYLAHITKKVSDEFKIKLR